MLKFFSILILFFYSTNTYSANSETEAKKTHLEDIFIWKMSDELKLTAQEEKQFTEINKSLNKKKSEINKKIQDYIQNLKENDSDASLKNYKKLIQEYNQITISEFDLIRKLLGTKKFISYLKIKNELTTKVKSILVGEKNNEKDEKKSKQLPPPKVIVETK